MATSDQVTEFFQDQAALSPPTVVHDTSDNIDKVEAVAVALPLCFSDSPERSKMLPEAASSSLA